MNITTSAKLPDRSFELAPGYRRRRLFAALTLISPGSWLILDFIFAAAGMVLAFALSPYAKEAVTNQSHISLSLAVPIFGLACVLSGHVFGLHDRNLHRDVTGLLAKGILSVAVAIALLVTFSAVVFYRDIGRHILGGAALSTIGLLTISRAFVWHFASRNPERIGLVGSREFVSAAQRFLAAHPRPLELCPLQLQDENTTAEEIQHWALTKEVDEIVFHGDPAPPVQESLINCLDYGVRVSNYATHVEKNHECVPVTELDHRWFLENEIHGFHPHYLALKRAMDIVLALLGLILSAPLMLLAVIAIKLESRGPAFYSQVRVGLRNKPFNIYKLRSMRSDAEANGAQWASKNDQRITRVGKILRKTRLDEVPQFWNILLGDMAFIGPRPERPEFVDDLAAKIPYYRQRHLVKPGLTGWAQISVPYGSSIEDAREKLRYDLYYVKHASLEFDIHICIRTIGAIMKGAR